MQSLQVSELETKTNSHLGFSNCQAEESKRLTLAVHGKDDIHVYIPSSASARL